MPSFCLPPTCNTYWSWITAWDGLTSRDEDGFIGSPWFNVFRNLNRNCPLQQKYRCMGSCEHFRQRDGRNSIGRLPVLNESNSQHSSEQNSPTSVFTSKESFKTLQQPLRHSSHNTRIIFHSPDCRPDTTTNNLLFFSFFYVTNKLLACKIRCPSSLTDVWHACRIDYCSNFSIVCSRSALSLRNELTASSKRHKAHKKRNTASPTSETLMNWTICTTP